MTIEIKVPALPESVADATVGSWHKRPGDFVKRGENLLDLETDKVVLEVPAPESGILSEITVPAGETVLANALLGKLSASEANNIVAAKKIQCRRYGNTTFTNR